MTQRMTHPSSLHGTFVPLITPFDADGQVAAGALEDLARGVLDAGATGIVALGTTAESSTLDAAEKRAVIEVCARVCAARDATLIVGAGSSDTRASAAALAALAEWPQISAALVPVPAYTRPGPACWPTSPTWPRTARCRWSCTTSRTARVSRSPPPCCASWAGCRTWPGSSSPPAESTARW